MENRRVRGQSLVELAVGLLVAIPAILLLIDAGVIMLGVVTNDSACRDAARAAAAGPPGQLLAGENRLVDSSGAPKKRAQAVLKNVYAPAGFVAIAGDECTVTETVRDPLPAAPTGGAVIGEVTVESKARVYPPFLVGAIAGQIQVRKSETYTYTYVVPSI